VTLDQLKYFYEAARFQHVGKAAKSVHISPSAISAAIASLESELRCKLFDRQSKSIILTEQGKCLRDEAEKVFSQISKMKEAIQGQAMELSGKFRLGASHFLSVCFLSKAWSQLQNQHSALVGEVCSLPTSQVLAELVSGTLDFGLCFSPFRHPDLEQIELYRGRLVVVVQNNHPLLKSGKGTRSSLMRLTKFPAAIHKGQPGVDLCEAHPIFERYGVVPQIRFLFDNDFCAVERVVSSESWAMIPDLVAKTFTQKIQAISLPGDWDASYSVSLVFRRQKENSSVLGAVRAQLVELLSKSGHRMRSTS
jgi:LysR family transcriptional regulator, transcriptional activator of the cysJI operon